MAATLDRWMCWACGSPAVPPGVDDHPHSLSVAVRVAVPVTPLLLDPSRRAITVVSAPAGTLPTKPETANKSPNNRVLTIRTNTLRQSATREELPCLPSVGNVLPRANRHGYEQQTYWRYTPSEAHSLTVHAWRVSLILRGGAPRRYVVGGLRRETHSFSRRCPYIRALRDPRRPLSVRLFLELQRTWFFFFFAPRALSTVRQTTVHLWGRWHGRSSTRRVPSSSAVDALPVLVYLRGT